MFNKRDIDHLLIAILALGIVIGVTLACVITLVVRWLS